MADLSGDYLIYQAVDVVILFARLCDPPGGVPLDDNPISFGDHIVNFEFAQTFQFSCQRTE